MKLKQIILIWLIIGLSSITFSYSQLLHSVEYFFDKDPGIGKGSIILVSKKKELDTSFKFSMTGLSMGLHVIYFRAKDSSGNISITHNAPFILYDGADSVSKVEKIEYFFDKDPGYGKGYTLQITPNSTIENNFGIVAPDNGKEKTVLYIRALDTYGRWSLLMSASISLCDIYKTKADFSFIRYGNQYTFIDSSKNNISNKSIWTYSDGAKDTIQNPVRVFGNGRNTVKLVSGTGCRTDSITKNLFTGIESYHPREFMAGGDVITTIYGGLLDSTVKITLVDSTGKVLKPSISSYSKDLSKSRIEFDLHELVQPGIQNWDLKISYTKSGYDTIIKKAFKIYPKPSDTTLLEPRISGVINIPQNIMANGIYKGNITFKNNGLVNANIVPFFFAVDQRIKEFSFDDKIYISPILNDTLKNLAQYFDVDTTWGKPFKSRVHFLYLSQIGPDESIKIPFTFKAPNNTDFTAMDIFMDLKIGGRMIGSYPPQDAFDCFAGIGGVALGIAGFAAATPTASITIAGVGLIWGITQLFVDIHYDQQQGNNINNLGTGANITGAALSKSGFINESCIAAGDASTAFFSGLSRSDLGKILGSKALALQAGMTLKACLDFFQGSSSSSSKVSESFDPNEKQGSYKYDTLLHYINRSDEIAYKVSFENDKKASRSAQKVVIVDTINSKKYQKSSFKLESFSIEDSNYTIPDFRYEFSKLIEYNKKSGINVLFNARYDTSSSILTTSFLTIDAKTGELASDTTLLGFLQPHKEGKSGQGSVSYSIKPIQTITNLDTLINRAFIYFDYNQPIITDFFKHTIDEGTPKGKVVSYKLLSDSTFTIYQTGADSESGIRDYTIYKSTNKGKYYPELLYISDSLFIQGQKDSIYQFYAIPSDNVGNKQIKKDTAELTVQLFNTKPISGVSELCVGNNAKLSSPVLGGTWSSNDISIATIDSLGTIKAVKAGNAVFSYEVIKLGIKGTTTKNVKIIPPPNAPVISRDSSNNLVTNVNGLVWYKDGVKISDTTQKIKPTTSGNYSVTTTQNGCTSAASANYYYLTTALSNLSNDEYFNISPNPTNGDINLTFQLTNVKDVYITIIDMNGRQIISNRKVSSGNKLNISTSMKGGYLIQVKDKRGKLLTAQKLIKN
jgi:hypothetical protein